MKTSTKIVISIISIVAILALIYAVIKINKNKKETWRGDDINMMVYFNDVNETANEVNAVAENIVATNSVNTTANDIANTNTTVITGIEEEKSSNENTESNNRNTAIELAKKEWGISSNSYTFEITKKVSDEVYEVSIRSKNTTEEFERYTVNVRTGTITEAQ